MRYRARPDLLWCLAGRHCIFLDLASERYFSIPREWNTTFTAAAGGDNVDPEDPIIKKLLAADILAVSNAPMVPDAFALAEPTDEVTASGQAFRSPISFVEGIWRQHQVARMLSREGLVAILGKVRRCSRGAADQAARSPFEYRNILSGFAATAIFHTHADRCLTRSIALLVMIRRVDPRARLVIGVASSPFAAHAWLQHDEIVLNDRLDRVRSFTPILVA